MRKKNGFDFMNYLKDHWVVIAFFVGVVSAGSVIPFRLFAVEQKTSEHEQSLKQIQGYINAYEETQQLIKQAPPGWRWDEKEEKYVPEEKKKGK